MNSYPQTDDDLTTRVRNIMYFYHTGKARKVSRDRLVVEIFGHDAYDETGNIRETCDRQMRDALAELPVVNDGGYFVPESEKEAQKYIGKMRSRQASIGKRLRILDQHLRIHKEPVKVEQMELLEI